MEYPGFIGGSYQSAAFTSDQEHTINMYVEKSESQGATSRASLIRTPGVQLYSTATLGPGRAHWGNATSEYAVEANTFYRISFNGVFTGIADMARDGNPATISSNGEIGGELFITSGGNGYLYDTSTSTFTTIAALAGKANVGGFLDGFFLALDQRTGTMFISDLLDGTTWDPTQFAQRSTAADPWTGLAVNNKFIWLTGGKTSDLWYNAGTAPFPFAPHPSGLVQYGDAAPFSLVSGDAALSWLGASKDGQGQVLRSTGFTPEVISTFGLQHALAGYMSLSDAVGESLQLEGHTFYILHFPSQGISWAWDSSTQLWSQWGTWLSESNRYTVWRPRYHAFAYGEHRILDSETGALYKLGLEFPLDVDSRPVRWLRRAPALMEENKRLFYSALELDLEPGLGTATGQGADPQVMMRMSRNSGKTWGSEQWRSVGKIGEYDHRVRWNRCGSARRRVFEVSGTDPVFTRITNAYLEMAQAPAKQQQRGAA